MAVTGRTSVPIEPGRRKTGAKLVMLPEASSQTYPKGALLIKSIGYIQMHTTSNVSVSLYGFAARSGGNGTADGHKSALVYKINPDGAEFKGALSGTYTSTVNGATCALSQNTAGAVIVVTAAAASDSSVARIIDIDRTFSPGDVNPVVLFSPLAAKVQEG